MFGSFILRRGRRPMDSILSHDARASKRGPSCGRTSCYSGPTLRPLDPIKVTTEWDRPGSLEATHQPTLDSRAPRLHTILCTSDWRVETGSLFLVSNLFLAHAAPPVTSWFCTHTGRSDSSKARVPHRGPPKAFRRRHVRRSHPIPRHSKATVRRQRRATGLEPWPESEHR